MKFPCQLFKTEAAEGNKKPSFLNPPAEVLAASDNIASSNLAAATMTLTEITITRHEAQARISAIEAEKLFLRQLLSTPLDDLVNKIKDRLFSADVQIAAEKKYIGEL